MKLQKLHTRLTEQLKWFVPCMLTTLLLTCTVSATQAQSSTLQKKRGQLESQMQKLQSEIKLIEAAIKNTSAKKQKSMSEILSLQAKIRSREKLIKNISEQVGELDETINQTQAEITTKTTEIEKMKQQYANMLRKSYENMTLQNQLSFLLSSNSFFDAVHRYNYLLKMAEFRRSQAKAIQQSVLELQGKQAELQGTKEEKIGLLTKQTNQKQELEDEKKEKDNAVALLQDKEKKLRKQVQDKNAAAQKLNGRIKDIIEEEIRLARKKAEEEAKRNQQKTTDVSVKKGTNETMPLTPQEQALSTDFANNMGKLPWPVLRGHIVSQFGKHEHPVLKGVMVENNGVDIKTEAGAEARAVFGGTVVSVFYLPTTQNCIIVKHGQYFTVYSNIETVSVKTNDKVTIKQVLGKLHTDKNDDLTKVHIEIWNGKDKMDPETWLAD